MIKQCKSCRYEFEITKEDLDFYDKISPVFNWVKYGIPNPAHCPDCRQIRRMAVRNERKLYKRRCNATEKNIISIYSPDKPYKVYSQEEWWSDKWNWLDYWMEFDFNKSFFEQFKELQLKVPRLAIMNKQSENSDYCNYSFQNKNCYLTFWSHREEECMYWNYSTKNKNCLDSLSIYESEMCYECIFSNNCYKWVFLDRSENCEHCFFSIDLNSCKNCIFCVWLRHKQYCILNKQYSKEEYFKKLKDYDFANFNKFQDAKKYFKTDLRRKFPLRSVYQTNCENCLWDNLKNSKNLKYIFNGSDSEYCKYWCLIDWIYNSMDMSFIGYDKSEACYEIVWCLWLYNCKFCNACWHNDNIIYCDFCFNSVDLFWCIGLKKNKYCILNKQYTKQQYDTLLPKIIEHMKKSWEWWEFPPIEQSSFAYNETVAYEHYPFSKAQILDNWWDWKEEINTIPKVEKVIEANKLPKYINDIPDDILNWAIKCELTWKPYRITPNELNFYRNNNIPIPHFHPEQRNKERVSLINPKKLWTRECDKCGKKIQSTFSSNGLEIVYCESCYLDILY